MGKQWIQWSSELHPHFVIVLQEPYLEWEPPKVMDFLNLKGMDAKRHNGPQRISSQIMMLVGEWVIMSKWASLGE
jgi:hypothetical protein